MKTENENQLKPSNFMKAILKISNPHLSESEIEAIAIEQMKNNLENDSEGCEMCSG